MFNNDKQEKQTWTTPEALFEKLKVVALKQAKTRQVLDDVSGQIEEAKSVRLEIRNQTRPLP